MIPGAANPLLMKPAAAPADYTVENSLKFNDGDSPELSRTYTSSATWTFSCWVKRGELGATNNIFGTVIGFNSSDQLFAPGITNTTAVYRDPSAWYHICVSDTGLFVNGVADSGTVSTSAASSLKIGDDFDGYLADVHFIDGTAKQASDFAETDSNGQWVPKEYTESYGTNGFHLPFSNTAGATAFVDSSSSGHTISTTGHATHTRAQKKVDGSSIYFDGNGDRLGVASSSDFNLTGDFTIEAWIRRNTTGTYDDIIASEKYYTSGFNNNWVFGVDYGSGGSTNYLRFRVYDGTTADTAVVANTYPLAADTWYHVALTRNGSGTNNCTMWVDGNAAKTFTYTGDLGDSSNPCGLTVGDSNVSSSAGLDFYGYIDEIRVSDTDRSSDGDFATAVSHDDDSNTLLLIHSDWNGGLFGDASGNTNDFADGGGSFGSHDQMGDTPSAGSASLPGNFCTLNPLEDTGGHPLSEGNLTVGVATTAYKTICGTQYMESGKWIFSMRTDGTAGGTPAVGLWEADKYPDSYVGGAAESWGYIQPSYNDLYNNGSVVAYDILTGGAGSIIVVAVDIDAGKMWFGEDGGSGSVTWASSGNPAAGTNATATFTAGTAMKVAVSSYSSGSAATMNFGADATFNDQESPSTVYADDDNNGVG